MTKGVLYSWNIASFYYCDKNKVFNNYYGLHYINKVKFGLWSKDHSIATTTTEQLSPLTANVTLAQWSVTGTPCLHYICRSTVAEHELVQDESREVAGKLYLMHAGESPDTNCRATLPKYITSKRPLNRDLLTLCCILVTIVYVWPKFRF